MNAAIYVVQPPPPPPPFPPAAMSTTYPRSRRTMSCKTKCSIFWCLLAPWALITIPVVIYFALCPTPSHDPFKFEVNFLEAKTRMSSSSPQTNLDVNVTLSVTTHHPVLFESFLASLGYDKNDQTVLSSTKLDDVFYLYKTKTMDIGMSVQNFTRKEDNLDLQVIVSGRYLTLEKGDEVDKINFKISCKGIKVVLVSLPDNITVSVGRMLGGPLPCK